MTRTCKTPAEVLGEVRAQLARGASEERTLAAAGLPAPNQRQFGITDAYAWHLFRPEPSMLPRIPVMRYPPVEREG